MDDVLDDARSDGEEQPLAHPFAQAPESRKKLFLAGLFCCIFGSIMQSATLSTMLPLAAQEIGGMEYYSVASSIGGPLSIALMPLFGYLGARNPAIKMPLISISFFLCVVAMTVRFFAPSMVVIIAVMALWCLDSPAIFVLGYSVIRDIYDAKRAGTYLGACATLMMLAMLFGPIGGGALMTAFGWRSLHYIIIPFLLVGAIAVFFSVRASKEELAPFATATSSFDFVGTIGLILFLAGLIMGLSFGTNLIPFGSAANLALFVVSIVGFAIFVFALRKRGAEAIIPATALRNRNLAALAMGNLCANFSNMALFFFLPAYIITVMGGDGLMSGVAIACMSVVGVFAGPVVGRSIGKAGNARTMLCASGILRAVVALALLLYLSPNAQILVVYALMLLAGVYNIMSTVSFSAGPQVQLPEELRVQGNSVVQAGQNLGSSLGAAVYTVVIGAFGLMGGMPVAIAISIAFALITSACALFLKKL